MEIGAAGGMLKIRTKTNQLERPPPARPRQL
jgi:hypothetical protein